jgi:pyruvate dehydrogenase E1 component alpha subunit
MSKVAKIGETHVILRYLRPDGTSIGGLPGFARNRKEMAALYRLMVLTRSFDEQASALQRRGRLGTYASSLGQEAVAVGAAAAMQPDDILLPTFREHGAQIARGVTLTELLLYWGGDERGSDFSGPHEDFPVNIPVASHIPHAVGAALAFKMRKEKRAALCIFGDGATSKGDFYEALNVAGVWQVPCVFLISNNQWAISVPRAAQTRSDTLAIKGVAAGIPGVQVDGNDAIAVREVVGEALDKARRDHEPSLIEAVTYRLGDHTTVDDASRYRDDTEVGAHWKEEPIARLRAFLTAEHGWSKDEEEELLAEVRGQIEAAVEAYFATDAQEPAAMFDYLHASLPSALADQRAELTGKDGGDG